MRGRKNKAVPHEDTHRWMVSYADFITLLFAFFVVMYAISSVNVSKYKTLAEGMHTAFAQKNNKQQGIAQETKVKNMNTAMKSPVNQQDSFTQLVQALSALQDSDYHMNPQDGFVELDIKAGALFDSGSAELRPAAVVKLMKLAAIIKTLPYPIAIEGYTDNMPIETDQYPSNWELSSARAAAVARTMSTFGVEQTQMSVTGYGEQYPVADNKTEEGRAQNRRVCLVIAKDKLVPRLLNPAISIRNKNTDKAATAEPEQTEPVKTEPASEPQKADNKEIP
ncbi:Chemotaxis protein MotB [Legionella massiliensis]|uniref:Chemotaxis protein MotB n=1 Tax=Legionella massiliensis TaxID=1034943 RepID=A0A078L380_9GAMM|nr:OmpA family protein [Legionella massiliensis]CDZ78569.1 Chemotaxis protein MotB [Legionella massiliensis]CEE14307.1 Motility protein B [Legionella massiliensis]